MKTEDLNRFVIDALEDIKGIDIRVLDVRDKTSITDIMVVVTGNSNRQVKALVDSVITKSRQNGVDVLGVEGVEAGEWALVDLGDVVVHIMQPSIRDFYNLEKLWGEESPASVVQDTGK